MCVFCLAPHLTGVWYPFTCACWKGLGSPQPGGDIRSRRHALSSYLMSCLFSQQKAFCRQGAPCTNTAFAVLICFSQRHMCKCMSMFPGFLGWFFQHHVYHKEMVRTLHLSDLDSILTVLSGACGCAELLSLFLLPQDTHCQTLSMKCCWAEKLHVACNVVKNLSKDSIITVLGNPACAYCCTVSGLNSDASLIKPLQLHHPQRRIALHFFNQSITGSYQALNWKLHMRLEAKIYELHTYLVDSCDSAGQLLVL